MSRSLASVLKTDSLKPLAQILRSKGRKGDTILAHISPKEAARLKREGGSGTINPDTGLPEFFGEEDYFGGFGDTSAFTTAPAQAQTFDVPVGAAQIYEEPVGPVPLGWSGYQQSGDTSLVGIPQGTYAPELGGSRYDTGYNPYTALSEGLASQFGGYPVSQVQAQSLPPVGGGYGGGADIAAAARGDTAGADIPRPPADIPAEGEKKAADAGKTAEKGFLDKLLSEKNLPLLALGGGGALLSAYRSQQAQSQAAKAAEQIKAAYAAAAAEQRAGAQPLLQAGGTALSQALQGTLSPANQQAMQAAQAKAAQAASQTGGVGAVQTAMSEADLRQRLLANQQSMALNLLGPANAQLSAAIQSELSGTTQGLQMRLNMSQQANQAAAGVYQSLATIMAAGLK
jgi:hypothetical protein